MKTLSLEFPLSLSKYDFESADKNEKILRKARKQNWSIGKIQKEVKKLNQM